MTVNTPFSALKPINGELHIENVPLSRIAEAFGTPVYVYSLAALRNAFQAWKTATADRPSLVCYAVKANSNLGILSVFARLGTGFDILSGGELARVLAAGAQANKIVFSGVGKSGADILYALEQGIRCFNMESAPELDRLEKIAASAGKIAPVSFRVNPNVDPQTHPYISTGLKENKFGVAYEEARALYHRAKASAHLRVSGIACHIGSQLLDSEPITEAGEKILELVALLERDGITLEHIDLGGGLGVRYNDENAPDPAQYLAPLLKLFENRSEELWFEPGRSLVANAGILLTKVEYLKHGKHKNFAVVDAAMNDLLRPALYGAYHGVVPVVQRNVEPLLYDVVGPICESSDFLAKNRSLALQEGDLLAVLSAGAYAMAMSSNYNSRPRAAEVMVDGDRLCLVRERETLESLFALERPFEND